MFREEEDFYRREKESESQYYPIKVKLKIIFILLIIFGIIFFLFQGLAKTKSLRNYTFAYEQDNKLYSLNLGSYSIDRFSKDPHLYINTFDFDGENYNTCFASNFLALVYDDFEISNSKNPYFAGTISLNGQKYCTKEEIHNNAESSYEKSIFLDDSRREIYTYDPKSENKYTKNFMIHGKKNSSKFKLRMLTMTEKYVDLTELLKEQGIKFQMKIDNKNKIVIISVQNPHKKLNNTVQEEEKDIEIKEEVKVEEVKTEQETESKSEDVKETKTESEKVVDTPSEDTGIKRERVKKTRVY